MSWKDRVVWREGMYLRPQHFQQQDRYLHALVERRASALHPYSWGITHLKINQAALADGHIAVERCRGIFDDGTPFELGESDLSSLPLESNAEGLKICLALLRTKFGAKEISNEMLSKEFTRYRTDEWKTRDVNGDVVDDADVEICKLRVRLILDPDRMSDETVLSIARVDKVEKDGSVVLDENFIPPCLDCQAIPNTRKIIEKTLTLLNNLGEYLSKRVEEGARGGVSEVSKYLVLQIINRFSPLFSHWSDLKGLHPLDLYEALVQLAGELVTFNPSKRRPPHFPPYRHDALNEVLEKIFEVVEEELKRRPEEMAVEIPLRADKFNFRVGKIRDDKLFTNSIFVLAAKADMATEVLRRDLPPQTTIGAPQEVTKLVKSHLPGVGLFPMPVKPPQIPMRTETNYFELEQSGIHWQNLAKSGGIAIHIPDTFPGLSLSLWAILG